MIHQSELSNFKHAGVGPTQGQGDIRTRFGFYYLNLTQYIPQHISSSIIHQRMHPMQRKVGYGSDIT